MRKHRSVLAAVSLALLVALLVNLTGCLPRAVSAENLMDGITPRRVEVSFDLEEGNAALTDFGLRLFRASGTDGGNVLISPLSVLAALAMTANGANANTLSEMESVLGMPIDELNTYLYSYLKSLPQGEKYKLSVANSIWFTDDERFTVNRDFLQTNADYFGADIYKTPFDDATLRDINNWVKQNTDGMIPKVLDQIPDYALMYLINALAFDAEWGRIYEHSDVRDGHFTTESGDVRDVELMYGDEGNYLEDELARGFIKYYRGGKYAFAALLPNEGVSIDEYVASLDGARLHEMLSEPELASVKTAIPKFETDYSVELSALLSEMGMKDAFDADCADFSDLGVSTAGNLYIGRVLHKTFISVGERGTRAGAVTVVEVGDNAACPPDEIKEVYLDRPFVYMLIDCENSTPFFIGALMDTDK